MLEQSDHMPSIPSGTPVRFASGAVLFRPGDPCGGLLVVKSGAIRVQTTSETGRQITLYRVAPNVACVLSTQCLMTGGVYPAEGVAETDVTGVFISAAEVETLVVENGAFRRWLFDAYGTRPVRPRARDRRPARVRYRREACALPPRRRRWGRDGEANPPGHRGRTRDGKGSGEPPPEGFRAPGQRGARGGGWSSSSTPQVWWQGQSSENPAGTVTGSPTGPWQSDCLIPIEALERRNSR